MTNTASTANRISTKRIVVTAMLIAISFVAVLIGRLVPNVAGFLSYDPKDAVIVIAGFIYGPMTAVVITVIVSLIEMLTISTTGIYGFIMDVFATCAFAVPAALVYKKVHSMKGAVLGLALGAVCMTGCMLLWNYIITPYYMGVERSMVAGMLIPTFLPFNLIKSGINLGLARLLYKPLVTGLRSASLLPPSGAKSSKRSVQVGFTLASLFVLATFVLLFLVFSGVL